MTIPSTLLKATLPAALAAMLAATPLAAQNDSFHPGPVIAEFGPVASVETDMAIPADAEFHVAFDVSEAAEPGEINRTFVSAARFINMHAEAGVPSDRIHVAIVVHGGASLDVTDAAFYAAHNEGAENASAAAVATLLAHGVAIYQCGQSAAAHGIANGDLLPGVQMALSAMTAHALLQQQGYTLNPF